MFQYLMDPALKAAHEFVESLGLINDRKFMNGSFGKLRALVKGELLERDCQFFGKCFEVLYDDKLKPKKMLRALIFIHLLLQTDTTKSEQLSCLLNQQISTILTNSKSYRQSNHKNSNPSPKPASTATPPVNPQNSHHHQSHQDSTESPKSEQISKIPESLCKSSQSSKIFLSQNWNSENSQKSSLHSVSEKQLNYVSEKEVLCQKIIQPYAFYLLKKSVCGGRVSCESFDSGQVEEIGIWQEINVLKLISKITSGFYVLGRYYGNKLIKIVIKLCPLLSQDIHKIYPKLSQMIKQKISKVARNQILSSVTSPKSSKQTQKLSKSHSNKENIDLKQKSKQNCLLQKISISECKELLTQISECNDGLIFFYMNKYLVDYLDAFGIRMPELMSLESAQCQYIFFKAQEEEKRSQKQMKKSQIIQKCKNNLIRNFIKIRKTTTCIETSNDLKSPKTPLYEAMTPNRLPKPKKFISKNSKNSSLPNQQIDELQSDKE